MERGAPFPFAQLEFGFLLGPPDGRYLARRRPSSEPHHILVLRTLGAPERRLLRRRRRRSLERAEPAPVPTTRATLVRAEPFPTHADAESWLSRLRGDRALVEQELGSAVRELNAALRAHRAAASDPYARDVSEAQALVARVGFGSGDQVAEGRFAGAFELPPGRPGPRPGRRARALAPDERFAAILGGRDQPWACEELLLRARADLDADRPREAALQARIALESLLAEMGHSHRSGETRSALEADRSAVGQAANAALRSEPADELQQAVAACVERMEAAVRRRLVG